MARIGFLLPTLFLLAGCTLGGAEPERYLLRLRFAPGQRFEEVVTERRESRAFVVSCTWFANIQATLQYDVRVGAMHGDVAEVEETLTRVRYSPGARTSPRVVDTADADSDVWAYPEFAAAVGQTISRTIDTRGHVHATQVPAALATAFMLNVGDYEVIRAPLDLRLPEQPIAVGDSWNTAWELHSQFTEPHRIHATHTLRAVERGLARIESALQLEAGRARSNALPPVQVEESTAQYVLDLATGQLIECSFRLTLTRESAPDELTHRSRTAIVRSCRRLPATTAVPSAPGEGPARK